MERVNVIIKREENGMFLATPQHEYHVGLHGYGKTVEAAIKDLHSVCDEAREFCPELPELDFNILYEVPSFLMEYSGLFSLAGLEKITGINQKQLGHYLNGNKHPRPATTRRIESAIINFRDRFDQVKFA